MNELNELIDQLSDEQLSAFITFLRSLTGETQEQHPVVLR